MAGFAPETFGRQTPRAFALQMEAVAARRRAARQHLIEQAWLTAMLGRADKIVPLHELLADVHPRDPAEVAAEQRARLRTLSATLQKRSWSEWLEHS